MKKLIIGVLVLAAAALPMASGSAQAFGDPVPTEPAWGAPVGGSTWTAPTSGFGTPKCYGVYIPGFGCW